MGVLILLAAGAVLVVVLGSLGLAHWLVHPPRRTFAYALAHQLPTDPGQIGQTFAEHQLRLAHGATTPAWLIDGLNPAGPIFVVSHGWAESRYHVLPRLSAILPLACAVLVYDLRAHGEATGRISRLGGMESADIRLLLDQLQELDPTRSGHGFVLLGYSMGAGASLVAAADDADNRIRAVIAEGLSRGLTEPAVALLRLKQYPGYPFIWLALGAIGPWIGGLSGFDRVLHARRLRCPLLMLHGTNDPISSAAAGRAIAAAAPHGRMVEFPNGGHLDLAQHDPQRYLDAVTALVKETA